MEGSKKIVLFFPAFGSGGATTPLSLLAISTPLLRAGYKVILIDSAITPHPQQRILDEVKDALCLGISLVTGPMIRETIAISRAVKAWNPDFPVILGGWHPSFLPIETLAAPYVDMVVRGQGESALLEVVQRLESGMSVDDVDSVGFKQDGKLIFNPDRPLRSIVEAPPKAYHLADFDAYQRAFGRRWAAYISSLACPFDCSYCTNVAFYGPRWTALPAGQVVEETHDLATRYRVEKLRMVDDNFLFDRQRALRIAEGLVRVGARFQWSIQTTTSLTARLSEEELNLLRRAGLCQIWQEAQSASPQFQKLMKKSSQNVDDIYQAAERCLTAGIRPSFNTTVGYPGEGLEERHHAINFINDVCRRNPGAEFWTNVFAPYPGSPIMRRVKQLGIEVPNSLEEWADYFPRCTTLPWLPEKDKAKGVGDTDVFIPLEKSTDDSLGLGVGTRFQMVDHAPFAF